MRVRTELRFLRLADRLEDLYKYMVESRAALIWKFVSQDAMRAHMDDSYGKDDYYKPGHERYEGKLFKWEEKVISEQFPKPPARVLVGAAGGGRESLALAAQGYEVVAFEPSPELFISLINATQDNEQIQAFKAQFADLPYVWRVTGQPTRIDLREMAPFDAAIIGWGSLSHVTPFAQRVETIKAFAALTEGPILASFAAKRLSPMNHLSMEPKEDRFSRLSRWSGIEKGTTYWRSRGFYHYISLQELEALAVESGTSVSYAWEPTGPYYGHAVLSRVANGNEQKKSQTSSLFLVHSAPIAHVPVVSTKEKSDGTVK